MAAAVTTRPPSATGRVAVGPGVKVGDNLLATEAGCSAVLQDLLETDPAEIGRTDIAVLNLLCAAALPGSERLDIPDCLARLKRLAARVKDATERNLYRFPSDPDYGHCEPMWRMAMLVTVVKRTYGAKYNPRVIAEKAAGQQWAATDSRDCFIHGLLDPDPNQRIGTCASIPVLVTAVARRLGYPVGLAVAGLHIVARWDGGGIRFSVEASNAAGMTCGTDDEYRKLIPRPEYTPRELNSSYWLRTLTPAEEFGLFMVLRVECLLHAAKYDETLLWSARSLQFAPDDPTAVRMTSYTLDLAMKTRLWRSEPNRKLPPADAPEPFFFQAGHLLRIEERSLYLTIVAHQQEADGELDEARRSYEDACRQNFHGRNEQRDLQRFLKVHGLTRRPGPLLPPENLGRPRRFELTCTPQEEAHILMQMAHRFEVAGELLKARDALHDLYLLNLGHSGVFARARAIELQPRFKSQLKCAALQNRQQANHPM